MSQFAVILFTILLASPFVSAQKQIEAGAFLDYLDVSETSTSNFGIGARFGYRVHQHVMFEGELAYDYGINFEELYLNVTNGNVAAIERTSIGVTQGLFGPKLQPPGRFRPFVTLKAGFVDFRLSTSLLPYSNVVSTTIFGLRESRLNTAIYPAGGVEAAVGPLGLRFELGDEIYFHHGTNNNLKITFGPFIRF